MTEPCEEVKRVEQLYEEVIDYMEKRYKDALDKIRAEIKDNRNEWIKGRDPEWHTYDRCLDIIDKHRTEKEDEKC